MHKDEISVGRAENLTGKKYGRLTVLYRVKNIGKQTAWMCECDCGTRKPVIASNLKNGNTQSCNCLQREKTSETNFKDITGQRFGRLVALETTNHRSSGAVVWKCKCDCGNICHISHSSLQQERTQSCGCLQREIVSEANFKDITGQRFGRLVALETTNHRSGTSVIWKCKCDCGNICYVSSNGLQQERTQSCGCISSRGEEKIAALCRENNLLYEQQKTFETCRFENTGGTARFDFHINQNYLIEFDGIQHFACTNGWNTLENFKQTQEHDAYKNQWCKDNNIPLIRIPYTKLDTLCIEDLLLETTQFRVV